MNVKLRHPQKLVWESAINDVHVMKMEDEIRRTLSIIKIKCHFRFTPNCPFYDPSSAFPTTCRNGREKHKIWRKKIIYDPLGSDLTLKGMLILKRLHKALKICNSSDTKVTLGIRHVTIRYYDICTMIFNYRIQYVKTNK